MLAPSDQPPTGWLKTITGNMFNLVAGLTIIAAVFYLAAITHILPLPESALTRLNEIRQTSWVFCLLAVHGCLGTSTEKDHFAKRSPARHQFFVVEVIHRAKLGGGVIPGI